MSTPSPTALVIASLIESLLAPVFTAMSAPLLERIKALEDVAHTPDEKSLSERMDALETKTAIAIGEKFDEAVLECIRECPTEVLDAIEDELTEKIKTAREDSLEESVASVIRNGSFNIEFSRY
jgi:hypothetical protein